MNSNKVTEHHKATEHDIEQYLVSQVKKQGGWAPKFVSPGTNGMPDRIVLLPNGRVGFVELKAPGEKPRPLQVYRHQQLRDLGFQVFVMDDFDQAQMIIDAIRHSATTVTTERNNNGYNDNGYNDNGYNDNGYNDNDT